MASFSFTSARAASALRFNDSDSDSDNEQQQTQNHFSGASAIGKTSRTGHEADGDIYSYSAAAKTKTTMNKTTKNKIEQQLTQAFYDGRQQERFNTSRITKRSAIRITDDKGRPLFCSPIPTTRRTHIPPATNSARIQRQHRGNTATVPSETSGPTIIPAGKNGRARGWHTGAKPDFGRQQRLSQLINTLNQSPAFAAIIQGTRSRRQHHANVPRMFMERSIRERECLREAFSRSNVSADDADTVIQAVWTSCRGFGDDDTTTPNHAWYRWASAVYLRWQQEHEVEDKEEDASDAEEDAFMNSFSTGTGIKSWADECDSDSDDEDENVLAPGM